MARPSRLVIDLGVNQGQPDVPDETSLGALVARTYVVGKIFSDRWITLSQIHNQMKEIWYIKGNFRIDDIPSDLLTRAKIAKLGDAFPVFLHYEHSLENVLGWQGFVRARIEFVVNLPLRPRVHVLDSSGKELLVKFKYERLGDFCFRCGMITHATYKCKLPRRLNEEDTVSQPTPDADSIEGCIDDHNTQDCRTPTVAKIVKELYHNTPVHASASKPSWKKLDRTTRVGYRTSAEEWVQAYEGGEYTRDGMGIVEPIPFGDPREPATPPAGYPLK
ncbi:hypothetical protein Tsubulata_047661 [Turnera subulata]|uniref:Zinc knuckle CX2CX4HX4C domain-containing protein n=1 Tax=Turnera subulata TaxID=218843 RepID=A0A9Q0F078_9ROSI|nr:hypothetical protein Tsubulata_047661 [Turnera subulata]